MSKAIEEDQKALVPRLRFREFLGSGEWKTTTISEICSIFQGGTPKTSIKSYWNGNVQWLTPAEMGRNSDKYISNTARTITDDGFANCSSKLLSENSVVLSTRAPIGLLAVNTVPMAINQGCRGLVPYSGTDSLFLYFSLSTSVVQLNNLGSGNTFKELSSKALAEFMIATPDKDEQQKIADCLTAIDERITATDARIDALKAHKKGLMQQLFPREGDTTPRLRFPEFLNAGEWATVGGDTLFSKRSDLGEDGLPIYSVTMFDGMVKRSSIERRVVDIAEPEGNRKVYKDDIAYNMMRMWQGACGVAPEDCMVSPAYVVLAPGSNACSDFFGYLFKLPATLLQLESHSQGLTQDRLRLYYKDFATIDILCPKYEEQQKIADCLSSLDELIAATTAQRVALREHKKGMMQRLFPSPAEADA